MILSIVLFECETWPLTKGEQGDYLRRIFGPKREEVVGGWGRLHNEEVHNSYTSSNIIRVIKSRRMRWVDYGRDEKYIQNFGENT
jgi:hypothetical protein